MLPSNIPFEEFVLRSLSASPLTKPFFNPTGWHVVKNSVVLECFCWFYKVVSKTKTPKTKTRRPTKTKTLFNFCRKRNIALLGQNCWITAVNPEIHQAWKFDIYHLEHQTNSNTNVTAPLRDEFDRNKETETSTNERIPKINGRNMKYRNTDNGIISTFVKLSCRCLSCVKFERRGGNSKLWLCTTFD